MSNARQKPSKVVALLEELTEELRREQGSVPEALYYDQTNSPLTRETHCRLVRAGKLPGYKVAGRVLVKRDDMHAFIDSCKVEPHVALTDDEDADVKKAIEKLGMRKTG